MGNTVRIDELADAVMEGLVEYADLAADEVKEAVKKAGAAVRRDIADHAPKRTGAYAKSWAVKNTRETADSLVVTVYSRNRYWLAHLLEFGHAKRGGGRVPGKAHIAPTEASAVRVFEQEIERALRG